MLRSKSLGDALRANPTYTAIFVIPAKAGIQEVSDQIFWIPACAGMTG
ncbi:MAG: hypothetical protein IPJ48_04120 [Propionivibrio sp.]|uniref:Uncharacterized protein n=1 Tax=Candidatus Propionivibrio dominans TaxID=2954373 RepID=A0A9D7F5E3_9RHOO|nr:hypothetical protein [Candidatus Propionivibrio dominans]